MSLAIGTISGTSTAGNGGGSGISPIALQTQLDQCQSQLGDWTSCSSGKTPEGQKIIAALEQKIGSLKAQIQTAANTANNNTATGASTITPPASLALASIGNLGTLLNTVA